MRVGWSLRACSCCILGCSRATWRTPQLPPPSPDPFSLREIYARAQQADGRLERMFGLVHDGPWVHVGTPTELASAERYMAASATLPTGG